MGSAHRLNILLHIGAGTAALVCGLWAISSQKGGRAHRAAGRWFIRSIAVVLVTAAAGVAIFEFRSFLALVTVLAAYVTFAGYRALVLRGRRPQRLDVIVSAAGWIGAAAFLAAIRRVNLPWNPVLTVTLVGAIVAWTTYDLLRVWLPPAWLQRHWLHEHIAKMMAAFLAVLSTFLTTVLPGWQPWAALVPAVTGSALAVWHIAAGSRVSARQR